MTRSTTLLDYLTQANPTLTLPESVAFGGKNKSSNTRNNAYPTPHVIKAWKEFKISTIRKLFSKRAFEALSQQRSNLDTPSPPEPKLLEIDKESTMTDLLVTSTKVVVSQALENSAIGLVSQGVWMELGNVAEAKYGTAFKPDWAGLSELQGKNNILPGDTKVSWKWRSQDVLQLLQKSGRLKKRKHVSHPKIWPIRQVLHYCIHSHARYGYIITDEELVVMRMGVDKLEHRKGDEKELREAMQDQGLVELKSIPWQTFGAEKLTVNLALWVLHILAANNGLLDWEYHGLDEEELMVPDPTKVLKDANPSFTTDGGGQSQGNTEVFQREDTEEDLDEDPDEDLDRLVMSFDARTNPMLSFTSNASSTPGVGTKRKRGSGVQRPRKKTM